MRMASLTLDCQALVSTFLRFDTGALSRKLVTRLQQHCTEYSRSAGEWIADGMTRPTAHVAAN